MEFPFKRAERLLFEKISDPRVYFILGNEMFNQPSQNEISHDKNKPFIGILHNYTFSHAVIEI